METALFELLKNVPGLKALIGERIYPLELPQGCEKPAITYRRAGGVRDYDMEGATGLCESRYFIKFYAVKGRSASAYKQAKGLRDLVVKHLSRRPGFRDQIGNTEIQSAIINDEDDQRLEGATGDGVASVMLDCTFWHRQTEGN